MLSVLLQSVSLDINSVISPILSIVGTIIVILSFGRSIAIGRKSELDRKLDKDVFNEYKIETNTRISHKVDGKLFEATIRDMEDDLRSHQKASDLGFRLLRETLEKTCATQSSTNELVKEMNVHIEYIKKNIDEIKTKKR